MGNSWKMRCVALNGSRDYTVGKVYTVENGTFTSDSGWQLRSINGGQLQDFESWCKQSVSWWKLVEDEMTIKEKISNAEAKVEKWQEMLDVLKQMEKEQEEKPLTGWENVKEHEEYYWMQSIGSLIVETSGGAWKKQREGLLNAFSTKEKALEIANAQLAYRMAKRFSDMWEGEKDENTLWEVFYHKQNKTLDFSSYSNVVSMADLFHSKECVKSFIDQHGKEYAQLLGWELEV